MLTIFGVITFLNDFSKAQKNIDLFNDILMITNSSTVEYGITSTFNIEENNDDVINCILKKFNFYDKLNKRELKNAKGYCIEFGDNNTNGYIETIRYENHNVITVNIVKEDSENNMEDLKTKLQECLKDKKINAKYFQYLKAKAASKDIEDINNKILTLLKSHRAANVNTINLENGYSTTAYTKQYDSIQSDSKMIDFNYAVCKYSSGSYVIIGTPELIVTY